MATPLPHIRESLVDVQRRCTPAFYQFLRALQALEAQDLAAQIAALARALGSPDGSVDNIPEQGVSEFLSAATSVAGINSIIATGSLASGHVDLQLVGDTGRPPPTAYYGTDSDGNKTFHPVADAFTAGEGIALAVDAGGVTEIGLADLPDTGAGALLAITRDGKGRVSGSRVAAPADVPVYRHDQPSAAATWTINHNLGRAVSVTVFTTGGVEVLAEVVNVTPHQTLVYLDAAMSGYAIVN